MTGSVRRRESVSRTCVALAGVALLALLAVAALLLGGAFSEHSSAAQPEAPTATVTAVGDHDQSTPAAGTFSQQPTTRARNVAFAVLVSVLVAAAGVLRRRPLVRTGRLRTLRIPGLPPGRAPPLLRIA